MFIKIPFESVIDFKTNVNEITKMSLEHDFNVNDGVVLGNFYISGEYKAHEVSINKEPFKYTLPFTVELRDDLKKDTLEFNIEDFSYEVLDNSKLKVNIEYSLTGDVEEDLFERVEDENIESELTFIDDFLSNEDKIDENEKRDDEIEIVEESEMEEQIKPRIIEELKEDKEEINDEELNNEDGINEERLSVEEEKTVMDTIKDGDDTFVTYHVHIVKESETIETIGSIYGVPTSLISEYNNIDSLSMGDKILIPKCDE